MVVFRRIVVVRRRVRIITIIFRDLRYVRQARALEVSSDLVADVEGQARALCKRIVERESAITVGRYIAAVQANEA